MSTDTDTFTFERDFPLPPDRMWHLMTDPGMREKWGVPDENLAMTSVETDQRVGGIDRHRCGPAEAPEFEVETRWYRLDAPHDAVFTEVIEAGGARLGSSMVTYRIIPEGGGSRVWVTVAVSSFVGPEMNAEFQSGWAGSIDLLAELAQHDANGTTA